MKIDLEALTEDASRSVWHDINGGAAAPLDEQDPMIQFSVKSKVLPIVRAAIPEVERHLKETLTRTINEAYDQGYDPEFVLMAVMAELDESTVGDE